jgi:hypothetical protein
MKAHGLVRHLILSGNITVSSGSFDRSGIPEKKFSASGLASLVFNLVPHSFLLLSTIAGHRHCPAWLRKNGATQLDPQHSLLEMATIWKRRRNEASILTSFSIWKQNEPAYTRTWKDLSEANPAYSSP